MASHLFGSPRGTACSRLLLVGTLLTAIILSGCSTEPGLHSVASTAIEGYPSVAALVLPEGPAILAGSSLLSLNGTRLEEQVRFSSEYHPPAAKGPWLVTQKLQPWDGAIVMVREASDGSGRDGDVETYQELVLIEPTRDSIATEVLLAAPRIDQVLVVPGDGSATVMAVVSGDEESGTWLSTLLLTPDGPPQAVSQPVDMVFDMFTQSADRAMIGVLFQPKDGGYGTDTELRVFDPDGSVRWSADAPFGGGLIGKYRGTGDSGWLVGTPAVIGPEGEERPGGLLLVTETSHERFELRDRATMGTGDLDARSPGDEILLLVDALWPGQDGSSVIVGTLADGQVRELYAVAEWEQRVRGVTVADVNGDGRSDIVVVVDTEPPRHYEQVLGRVELFLNSEDGFGPPLVSPVYDSIASFDLIDVDGDGMLEVVIAYVAHPEEADGETTSYVDVLKIK